MKLSKKWLWVIIPLVVFFLCWMNSSSVSTVLLGIKGAIIDGNLIKFSGTAGVGEDAGIAASEITDTKTLIDSVDSPCIITGGVVTEGTTPGTFKVEEITAAYLRTLASPTAPLVPITLAEQDDQDIPVANTIYRVILTYGDPCTITLSETMPNGYNAIPIGKVMKDGSNNVSYLSNGYRFGDGVRKLHRRAELLREIELYSGSAIEYSGTDNFTMEAGIAFSGINEISFSSYDSVTTQFTYVYSDGAGGWTESNSNTVDYAHYDDGDGTLGNIGVAKYGVHYVYRHVSDGHVYIVYGTGSYTLAEAEVQAIIPPTVPFHLDAFGCQIGTIIAPQSGGTFTAVIMVTSQFFSGTEVVNHNNLGGLQGGTADDYWHMTEEQHTIATQPADTDNSGYLSNTDWNTFNDKMASLSEDPDPELGGELDAGAHSIGFTLRTATGDGTTTIDWRLGNKFKFTFGAQDETFTFIAPSNPCTLMLTLIQDATGGRTVTWPATVKWPGGAAPALSTAANARDKIALDWDGTQYDAVASLDFK